MSELCIGCGGRAFFAVEPVGRYDPCGWAEYHACSDCLGEVAAGYVEELPRVQVRHLESPSSGLIEDCCNEGCTGLVDDGGGMCLRCERDVLAAVGGVA